MNTSFKIALLLSIAVHGAILAPYAVFQKHKTPDRTADLKLNYVLIQHPELTVKKENFTENINVKDNNEVNTNDPDFSVSTKQETLSLKKITEKTLTTHDAQPEEASSLNVESRAFLEYYNLIREKIRYDMHKHLKSTGRGEVKVIFTISPEGTLLNIDSVETGISELSNRIYRSINSVTPFPPFPMELGGLPITFCLTVKIG